MNFLNLTGLQEFYNKLKQEFVKREVGKGLSTNDYTNADKLEVTKIKNKAEETELQKVKEEINNNKDLWSHDTTYTNATASKDGLMSVADKKKLTDLKQLVYVSELENDKNFQSKSDVQALINSARHMSKEVVDVLPSLSNAKENVIYLVPKKDSDSNNVYDEYLLINGQFEKIGDTETKVDLSSYVQTDDLKAYVSQNQIKDYVKHSEMIPITRDQIDKLI